MGFKTEQEEFWVGNFGEMITSIEMKVKKLLASNLEFFQNH